MRHIEKPKGGEFPPCDDIYITPLPDDGLLLRHLKENFEAAKKLVLSLPPEKLIYRYDPGKWTIKEILVHIVDDERIYAYRLLCIARNDRTPLPGFEQDDYVRFSGANERDIANILEEYESVRNSTIALLDGLPEDAFTREGVANGNRFTVRALAYHLAGHEMHHLRIIEDRYLKLGKA